MGGKWRPSHTRARESESSVEGGVQEEDSVEFHFSEEEDSSCSSGDDEDVFTSKPSMTCPNAPFLRYTSPPETPRSELTPQPTGTPTHVQETGSLRAQRPLMRLDLSSLPPPFGATRLSPFALPSPRPPLSRFSSDDGLSPRSESSSAPPSAMTPNTESALSAFGIAAAGRRSPAGGLLNSPLPTPPIALRGNSGRRRIMGELGSPEDRLEHRNRSPRAPSSPLQHLVASASGHEDATTRPRTPLLDFEGARAVYHRLLPGSHALLKRGDTPSTDAGLETSYFAVHAQ